jgi:hypothetical protein
MMWSAYYPYLDCLAERRPPTRMAMSTIPLIEHAIEAAIDSEAHLLHQMQKAANAQGGGVRKRVARLISEVHGAFEEAVGASFRAAGARVETGLDQLSGRPLPCGEVDVLAVIAREGAAPLALVCEAKNSDLSLQKDFGYAHLATTLKRARAQIAAKAVWVGKAWPALAPRFDVTTEPSAVVLGLIVTRRPVPIGLLGGWPGVVPSEIEGIVRHLRERPPEAWRGDLARGVVGDG